MDGSKRSIAYGFMVYILFACVDTNNSGKAFPEIIRLTSQERLLGDVYMRYPFRIRINNDSCLYIMDLHASEYYCHEFIYPSMAHKQSFGKRGEAPNEFLDAENIRLSQTSDIWMLDANKKKIVSFDEKDKSIIQNVNLSIDVMRALDFTFYNDSTFIIPDYTGENRFCFVNLQGKVMRRCFSIPLNEKNNTIPKVILAQAWRSFIDYNPDNGIMAMVTQLGQVVDIYDLKADTLVNVVSNKGGVPQFTIEAGHAIPNGIMGYSDVFVGKTNIYAVFWGHSFDDIKKDKLKQEGGHYIHVFDLKGNPVIEYVLDRYITGFSIDEDRKRIIALDVNSNQPLIEYFYP